MKNKIYFAVVIVLTAAIAAYCGYVFCIRSGIDGAGLEFLIPAYILSLVISVFLCDLVHEGAHMLVGLCCSMGVKKPKYRLFKSSSVEVNPKGDRAMRARIFVTTAAGLFINILLGAAGVIALFVPGVPKVLCAVLPYSFYTIAINIAPMECSDGKTDGLVLWELITSQDSAKVMLAILKVQGAVNSGTNLQDVDENLLFDLPQLPEDDINFIILTQLRYEYFLAKGNDSEANKYFTRYKDLIKYLPSGYSDER